MAYQPDHSPECNPQRQPEHGQPGGTRDRELGGIISPTADDWIGLYSPGGPDNAYLSWRYTNGAASGSLPFSIPASISPGTYELRLYANNSYTRLATSGPITIRSSHNEAAAASSRSQRDGPHGDSSSAFWDWGGSRLLDRAPRLSSCGTCWRTEAVRP